MKAKKIIMGAAIAVFFLAILFPLWGWIFPQPVLNTLNEKRALTELDQTGNAKQRIENAEAYLDDHLAFRNLAISTVLRADVALGESPSPLVLAGSDGWLFYVDGSEDFRRGEGLTEDQIRSFYDVHQQLTDRFAAQGIDYRVMLCPDKHSVYPQYLPLTRRLGSGKWELKQLMTPPGPEYTVRIIDVSDALQEAAAAGVKQYYKTDSHWNLEGGWTAYNVMMDQLVPDHPNLRRLTEDDLVRTEYNAVGDLAELIGQPDITEDVTCLISAKDSKLIHETSAGTAVNEYYINEANPDGPRILMVGDSFRASLIPFLAESVSRLDMVMNDTPSLASIEDLSVYDIIIYEAVERNRFWLWDGLTGLDGEEEAEEFFEEEYEGEYEGE